MTNNVTITKSGVGTVRIFTTKVESVWEKKLNLIKIPRSKQRWSLGPKIKIIDLLVLTHNIIINGYIAAYGSDTAQQQKAKLEQMLKAGGNVTLTYDGTDYSVNFTKCSIVETSEDTDTPESYDVMISVVEGEER